MPGKMTASERKEHLKKAIADAFADVPYPGDTALKPHPTDYEEQHQPRQQAFEGYHWRDLPRELADEHAVIFVRPEAKRFYLPAYLFIALNKLENEIGTSLVVFELDPPEHMGRFKHEYDAYTPAQRNAIRLFLECVRDESGERSSREAARDALDRYWGKENSELTPDEPTITAEPTRKDLLKQAIRDAFADVPYPGDNAIGYEPLDPDAAEINQNFATYHWGEVPRGALGYHSRNFPLFSKKGKQFYLPAYLLGAIDDLAATLETVVYCLSPYVNIEWPYSDYELYSKGQRDVIRRFLEYVRDEMNDRHLARHARVGLDMIWTRETPWPAESSPESTSDPARKEQVKQAILDAFADVPYPGDDEIARKDSSGRIEEEVVRDFKGVDARAVPRKVFLQHHDPSLKFSVTGLQYYLPAYLTAALENVGDLVYWVVYFLDPTDRGKGWFLHDFGGYSPAQKSAIARFLEYVRDAMPHVTIGDVAQHALDHYWSKGQP